MKQLNIGLLYLSLHNQLKRKAGMSKLISRKDFFTILGKHFLIPKNMRIIIIEEMKDRDLIKQQDKENIIVLPCEINLETDANKLYKMAGLF